MLPTGQLVPRQAFKSAKSAAMSFSKGPISQVPMLVSLCGFTGILASGTGFFAALQPRLLGHGEDRTALMGQQIPGDRPRGTSVQRLALRLIMVRV
jgi:hypothetical protein